MLLLKVVVLIRHLKVFFDLTVELGIHRDIGDGRFNLAIGVIDRIDRLHVAGAHVKELLKAQIIEDANHAYEEGIDGPEFGERDWPFEP